MGSPGQRVVPGVPPGTLVRLAEPGQVAREGLPPGWLRGAARRIPGPSAGFPHITAVGGGARVLGTRLRRAYRWVYDTLNRVRLFERPRSR